MFKEGSIVIPNQLSYSDSYPTLQLASSFIDEEIELSQFYDATNSQQLQVLHLVLKHML